MLLKDSIENKAYGTLPLQVIIAPFWSKSSASLDYLEYGLFILIANPEVQSVP